MFELRSTAGNIRHIGGLILSVLPSNSLRAIISVLPRQMLFALLTMSLVSVSSNMNWAQSTEKLEAETSPKDTTVNDQLDQGAIEASTSIVGANVVSQDGHILGEIADLMLDLERGHVSTVIVDLRSKKKGGASLIAIPWGCLERTSQNNYQLSASAEKLNDSEELEPKQWVKKATRRWAASIYKHFDLIERAFKQPAPKLDQDELLTRATALEKMRVNDLHGTELGRLSGFAVATRDGLLVYAALSGDESTRGLQAIPLSAFIVNPARKEWLLDLSKEALMARPHFPRSAWPESIDRGWSEYVHVLYGRPIFEGVRSSTKPAEVQP